MSADRSEPPKTPVDPPPPPSPSGGWTWAIVAGVILVVVLGYVLVTGSS